MPVAVGDGCETDEGVAAAAVVVRGAEEMTDGVNDVAGRER